MATVISMEITSKKFLQGGAIKIEDQRGKSPPTSFVRGAAMRTKSRWRSAQKVSAGNSSVKNKGERERGRKRERERERERGREDRKSTRLNSSHLGRSRMPSSA